jgi:hypothetical protein
MSVWMPPYKRDVIVLLCECITDEQLQSSELDISWETVSRLMNSKGVEIGELDCSKMWRYLSSDFPEGMTSAKSVAVENGVKTMDAPTIKDIIRSVLNMKMCFLIYSL